MIDMNFLREYADKVKDNISNKNANADVDNILELDKKRRELIVEVESLKSERNSASKEIAQLKKNKENADAIIGKMKEVSSSISELDNTLREIEKEMNEELLKVPNMCHDSVPIGRSEKDNITVREWGEKSVSKTGLNHIEIAEKLGIIDFKRGAKVTGSGFAFLTGKGAKLERALINFFLDCHEDSGYTEIFSPFVVNEDSMRGTGQLPKMAEDMYHAGEDNVYLIPTAEVPLTNFHRNDMINLEELPKKFCGYSACFRREAGSYGKEVRGFLRVHQFNKVELVKFSKPEESEDELESLTNNAEELLKQLGLSYRVLLLCTGDTSFASSKTYDLEVWSSGEEAWLEVSSCSNFGDFQARRANIRFKRKEDMKPEFVHTLNGSGLATPRILVSLIENNFDGEKIVIPEVLRKYTGFDFID